MPPSLFAPSCSFAESCSPALARLPLQPLPYLPSLYVRQKNTSSDPLYEGDIMSYSTPNCWSRPPERAKVFCTGQR
ncbi:hypothetical protein BDV12DRAFT_174600 [Aspergillus spectabilis]